MVKKYSVIKVNSNGGMGGGYTNIYTSTPIEKVMNTLNDGKFFSVVHECSKIGKRTYVVNPSWVSSVYEMYASKSSSTNWCYSGITPLEANNHAEKTDSSYLIY